MRAQALLLLGLALGVVAWCAWPIDGKLGERQVPAERSRQERAAATPPLLKAEGVPAGESAGRPAALSVRGTEGWRDARSERRAITGWIRALRAADAEVRADAAFELGQLGTAASAAVAALIAALRDDDPEVASRAADALGSIGRAAWEAVPALNRALVSGSADRADVAHALSRMAPRSLGVLTAALRDENGDVRHAATRAFAWMKADAEGAVPQLLAALDDEAHPDRHNVVSALGSIGPHAKDALPTLTRLLDHESNRMRAAAASSIGRMGPAARTAVPALIGALDDDYTRFAAINALHRLGPAADAAIPALEVLHAQKIGNAGAALHRIRGD